MENFNLFISVSLSTKITKTKKNDKSTLQNVKKN